MEMTLIHSGSAKKMKTKTTKSSIRMAKLETLKAKMARTKESTILLDEGNDYDSETESTFETEDVMYLGVSAPANTFFRHHMLMWEHCEKPNPDDYMVFSTTLDTDHFYGSMGQHTFSLYFRTAEKCIEFRNWFSGYVQRFGTVDDCMKQPYPAILTGAIPSGTLVSQDQEKDSNPSKLRASLHTPKQSGNNNELATLQLEWLWIIKNTNNEYGNVTTIGPIWFFKDESDAMLFKLTHR